MGRPWYVMSLYSLIPNFSYLSEVGASFLDDQMQLGLVPQTRLVGLSSPSFHYLYRDRNRFERGLAPLPTKVGSLQQFLSGYENASQFLRRHPPLGRPRSLFERDLSEEHAAHKLSRRKERARLRMCFIAIKRFLLCRYGPGPYGSPGVEECEQTEPPTALQLDNESSAYPAATRMTVGTKRDTFAWTERTWREFRLELEKLVVLDFLMRNTDRGLDNFMIHYNPHANHNERSIRIGAIDNSLAFPHQHPQGLRDYPYGWLFLPTNLIGGAFSDETRAIFLPKLTDPLWWASTIEGLRHIFRQDAHFHERTFQNQMDVLRGQGIILVQCLQRHDQGPIELCAYPKRLVRQSVKFFLPQELDHHTFADLNKGRISWADEQENSIKPLDIHKSNTRPTANTQARSAPKTFGSAFHDGPEQLAIDVVERMNTQGKRASISSANPSQSLPRRSMKGLASPIFAKVTQSPHISQQMHSLDLAEGQPHSTNTESSSLPPVPVPVIVEHVEHETRRPWLWWY